MEPDNQTPALNSTKNNIVKRSEVFKNRWHSLYTENYCYTKACEIADHTHEFLEIGITLEGNARHCFHAGSRTEIQQLSGGSLYLIAPGHMHRLEAEAGWKVQNFYLLPKALPGHFPSAIRQTLTLACTPSLEGWMHCCLSPENLAAVKSLLNAYSCCRLKIPQAMEEFQSYCLSGILHIVCDALRQASPKLLRRPDSRILTAVTLIEENLSLASAELSSLICSSLALHPQSVNRLFRQAFGITLNQFILECKLENSCRMLLDGGTITDAAIAFGFYDHSHYNKYFLRHFGITPSQYRAKYYGSQLNRDLK